MRKQNLACPQAIRLIRPRSLLLRALRRTVQGKSVRLRPAPPRGATVEERLRGQSNGSDLNVEAILVALTALKKGNSRLAFRSSDWHRGKVADAFNEVAELLEKKILKTSAASAAWLERKEG